jgi:crotonobetainyl-CoA:carnitine CoA-transferase CaiB-like acyl-CoA transferase
VRRRGGVGQRIDMALFDTAIHSLTTFLPAYFTGGAARRLGNGHSMCSPWNIYPTKDGWILLCCPSDPPWQRLCEVMGRPDLIDDARFATLNDRVAIRDQTDALVSAWTRTKTMAECEAAFAEASLACGPVLPVKDLVADPNIRHRGSVRRIEDPVSGGPVDVPAPLLRTNGWDSETVGRIPVPDGGRAAVADLIRDHAPEPPEAPSDSSARPLVGLRALEIGQFTTAPLVARQLGVLGAEVIKIEPLDGDQARVWAPHQGGLSYFFVMSNSEKRSVSVDLRSADGKESFAALLGSADVLIENLKPGSLARLGFGADDLARINPRLIYCAISGFGADQAMSGIMDATQDRGTPLKSGISSADILGGQGALLAVLAAIEQRERTDRGCAIDLSMQDLGAWVTQTHWNGGPLPEDVATIACRDGYVCAEGGDIENLARGADKLTRAALVEKLTAAGIAAAPVATIAEAAEHPQIAARGLIQYYRGEDGTDWPLLASPMRLSRTPPASTGIVNNPRPLDSTLLDELGIMVGGDSRPKVQR